MKIFTSNCIQKYKCLIQDCELNCCSGWQISVSKEDVEKWKQKAPQLLKFLNEEKNSNGEIEYTMKRDFSKTCSALNNGICEIQKEHGEDMIPNLCSYFPHVYKKMQNVIFSSATMACPAVADIVLKAKNEDWKITEYERKYTRNDISDFSYRVENIPFEKLAETHYKFLKIFDDKNYSVDECMFLLVNICYNSKGLLGKDIILKFDNFYKTAIENLEKFDKNYSFSNAQYKILDTMLHVQTNRNNGPELDSMFDHIKQSLGFEDDGLKLTPENFAQCIDKYNTIKYRWDNEIKTLVDGYLRNIIKGQLNAYFFPFCCYFYDHNDMIINISMFYLFLRLVMMCELNNKSSAMSIMNIRRILSVVARTFYGSSSEKTFNKIKDKRFDLNEVIQSAILRY